ncbi:MAG: fibronectin type III domain-containing protein [Myxococcales bacterium]|nr:fibronectin type III domain-containing protein [Myxococcales bacterium]
MNVFPYNFRGLRLPLLSGSRGDRLWFFAEGSSRTTTFDYESASSYGSALAPDMAVGTAQRVSVRMEPPPTATMDLTIDIPGFERLVSAQGAGLLTQGSAFYLNYSANLRGIGRVSRGWYANVSTYPVAFARLRSGHPNALGRIVYPDVFPAEDLLAMYTLRLPVPVTVGAVSANVMTTHTVTTALRPTLEFVPKLGLATGLAINGAPSVGFARAGVGLTPTVSWTPPSLGTVDHYELRVMTLDTQSVTPGWMVVNRPFSTTHESFVIPPQTLMPGRAYVVVLSALQGSYRPLLPNFRPIDSDETQAVSGVFTP